MTSRQPFMTQYFLIFTEFGTVWMEIENLAENDIVYSLLNLVAFHLAKTKNRTQRS